MIPSLASPTADMSVRPALAEDAGMLGDVHARTLRATLAAGLGRDLGADLAGAIDASVLAERWAEAITAPPSPRHRVLTALDGARVVGFAAFAPAEIPVEVAPAAEPAADPTGPDEDAPDPGEQDVPGTGREAGQPDPDPGAASAVAERATGPTGEVLALEVPPAEQRRGHGSRLLAACADLLRQDGIDRMQLWVVAEDEARTRFLSQAGFAPAGVRRQLDVAGTVVTEVCWHASL